MADGISYVVAQRSDGEGKFIYALSVSQKGENKVATPHVMREIAKERLSKRVVPEILYEATAVRVCMGLPQADLRSAGIALEQEWPDGIVPGQVDQFLVDRKSTRLNSSHLVISYAVFCLKKKK